MAKWHLQLKNNGKAKEEVETAIKYKETSEIYGYGAISRFKVEKWQECIIYCKKSLVCDENCEESKMLMKHSLNEIMKDTAKMNEMSLINKLEDAKKQKLFDRIKEYGIKIGKKLHFLPQDIGANLYIDDYNILHFPVILWYDEVMQCDFIQDFPHHNSFREQIAIVLENPAPWDPLHRYKISEVDVFFETNISEPIDSREKVVASDRKFIKVDLDSDLLSVLRDERHIVPQYPIFNVVARDYQDYKKYTTA
jgi:hypothetical protein